MSDTPEAIVIPTKDGPLLMETPEHAENPDSEPVDLTDEPEIPPEVQEMISEWNRLRQVNANKKANIKRTLKVKMHDDTHNQLFWNCFIDYALPQGSLERLAFEVHWEHELSGHLDTFAVRARAELEARARRDHEERTAKRLIVPGRG